MKNNLAEIVRRAQKAGAKVILLGMKIPPITANAMLICSNNVYPQLAKELNIPLVPFLLEDVRAEQGFDASRRAASECQGTTHPCRQIEPYLFPLLKEKVIYNHEHFDVPFNPP